MKLNLRGPAAQTMAISVATAAAQGLTALMMIYGARTSMTADFGQVATALAVGGVLSGVLNFGSNELWVRDIANGTADLGDTAARLQTKVGVSLLIGVVWTLLFLPTHHAGLWAAGMPMFTLLLSQTAQVPVRARARPDLVAISMILDRLAAILALFVFHFAGLPVVSLVAAMSLGNVVGAVFCWRLRGAEFKRVGHPRRLRFPWSGSQHYGVASLGTTAWQLDVPLLAARAGADATGLYGAVNRWVQPMVMLVGAFSMASIPFIARAESLVVAWRSIRKASILLVAALLFSLGIAVFATPITVLLLGEQYRASGEVLRWLALGTAIVAFNQPASTLLQATGHDRLVSVVFPVGVIFQLAVVYSLAPTLGALAAAVGFFGSQVVMALMLVVALMVVSRSRASTER